MVLNNPLGDVSFAETYENLMAEITALIHSAKDMISDSIDRVPSEIPSDCPELIDPFTSMVKEYIIPDLDAHRRLALADASVGSILAAVNAQRHCPDSVSGFFAKSNITCTYQEHE